MLRLRTACRVADLLWPRFERSEGVILLADITVTSGPEKFESLSDFERFFSHTHLFDLFAHSIPLIHDNELDIDRPDPAHPEFAAAWQLAKCIGQMWFAKLQWDFPHDRFRVYVTKLDDPIVHFHKGRSGERLWLTDEECADQLARDEIAIYDTGQHLAAAV